MANIFISHVEEEKSLAFAVERFLREIFKGETAVTVFLSSNIYAMTPGEKFEERIRAEIAGCRVFLMMCSNTSFRRHWIHVEAGAAWVANRPIVPVCYGNKLKGSLPRPYSSFHALNLDVAHDLVIAVASKLGLRVPSRGPSRIEFGMSSLRGEPIEGFEPYRALYATLDHLLQMQHADRQRRKTLRRRFSHA
jgi:hypothetical protein